MTNFERIAECPEKAAEFFDKMLDEINESDGGCYFVHRTGCKKDNCIECITEWLKQEAREDSEEVAQDNYEFTMNEFMQNEMIRDEGYEYLYGCGKDG